MNILYLGHFLPQDLVKTVITDSKAKIGFSNHNFEMSVINGLMQNKDVNLSVLTIPGVFSFPYNNNNFFTKKEVYYKGNTLFRSVGFCNLPIIKEYTATLICAFHILKLIRKFEEGSINVIINTPSKRLLDALSLARKFTNRKLTQTVIIPDIPSLVSAMDKCNWIKRSVIAHRDNNVMKKITKSDGLVLLTEGMADLFDRKPKYIVMEGIIDAVTYNDSIKCSPFDCCKEIILYSGTLRKIFGIMNLIEAFRMIPDDNIELHICGSGEAADDIVKYSHEDSRIRFYGLVSSEEAKRLQNMATILVNPRTSSGLYTKYSFPSKTIEYLLAAKTVVINRLPGIPDDYYKYVYTPNDESIESLSECLKSILKTDKIERLNKAISGKEYILKNKNSKLQASRIIELIKTYC